MAVMKFNKKFLFGLVLLSLLSLFSFYVLNSESSHLNQFSLISNVKFENMVEDSQVLNPAKLVKFLFETLIKLVPGK